MSEKEKTLPPVASGDMQGTLYVTGDNLSSVKRNVKSKEQLDKEYLENTFTRFSLLSYAKKLLLSRSVIKFNSNFSGCHCSALQYYLTLVRNPNSNRAYYNGIVTCHNSKLCPVCSPRIMGFRSAEIKKAVHEWLVEFPDNTCYMLTLTVSHSINDSYQFLLSHFKNALKMFWRNGSLVRILKSADYVGRITSNETQYSQINGFHPHQHILLFCKKTDFDIDSLKKYYLSALDSCGLSGSIERGLDIIEARSASCYLTKISSEMTMGNLKQGRQDGHYSPMQILFEAMSGSDWAADVFCELFEGMRGLDSLRWSRGLKARFGIGEVSDEDITKGEAQKELEKFMDICSDGFNKLSASEKALLRNYAAVNDFERASNLLRRHGILFSENFNNEGVDL